MVRTYTGHTGCVSMIFNGHHWGPQAVYQAEKPGAPESETERKKERQKKRRVRIGALKRGEKEKLVNKGLQWEDWELSQPVSLPLKHESVKTELVLTSPRINREHARAGRADTHKNCFYKQVLRY